jgi:hypothetical protein
MTFKSLRAWLLAGTFAAVGAQAMAAPVLRSASNGNVWALVVGIDDYAKVNHLHGAKADAEDIYTTLTKKVGVPADHITALMQENATRDKFVGAMTDLIKKSKAGDLVIISYAGHGARVPAYKDWKRFEPDGQSEEFLLINYDRSGEGTKEVIANKEMKAWLSRLDAKKVDVLLIADSCFGGGMVRGWDPRSGEMSVRVVRDAAAVGGDSLFKPIPMTPTEMTVTISDLKHVTFLAGADRKTPVPEIKNPDPNDPNKVRGALSYSVARALEGGAADKSSRLTTRSALFDFSLDKVLQLANERQQIDIEPSADTGGKDVLFRLVDDKKPEGGTDSSAAPPTQPLPPEPSATAVKIAVLNGAPDSLTSLDKGIAPLVATDDKDKADLVWDLGAKEILAHGDSIIQDVTPHIVPGVVDRTAAITFIKQFSLPRTQAVRLKETGKRYTPSDHPTLQVEAGQNKYLIVFNIAADGRVQMLDSKQIRDPKGVWSYSPNVVEPFGADCVVAVVSDTKLKGLDEWLNRHDNTPVAGLLSDQLGQALKQDPTLRIGTVGLYTARQ